MGSLFDPPGLNGFIVMRLSHMYSLCAVNHEIPRTVYSQLSGNTRCVGWRLMQLGTANASPNGDGGLAVYH